MKTSLSAYAERIAILSSVAVAMVIVVQCSRPLFVYAWKEQQTLLYLNELDETSARELIGVAERIISQCATREGRFIVAPSEFDKLSLPKELPAPVAISGNYEQVCLVIAQEQDSRSVVYISESSDGWVIDGLAGEYTQKITRYYPKK